MLVCHCKRVSDRTIRKAIDAGARCRREVAKACGAGTGDGCGGCRPVVDELLAEGRSRSSLPLITLAALVSGS